MSNLSTELSTDGLGCLRGWGSRCLSGGCGTGTCHLDGENTTEWAGCGGVDKLDKAHVGLASNGSGAGGASWDGGGEWVVLVDICGTLDDAHGDESAHVEGSLLGGGDVAVFAWHLGGHLELLAGGESTGSGGVDDGGVWASSVSGDDVESSGDGATWGDLGNGAAGLSYNSGHAGESVGASLGLSESVRGGLLGGKDGGVDFGLLVGSGTWDDATLNTESSGVSTSITGNNCDLSVGSDERGCCKSNEEEFGEHLEDYWGGLKRTEVDV